MLSDALFRVRAMRTQDVAAVLEVQSRCHDEEKLETAAVFLAKLKASPQTCFVALCEEQVVGYLVAVPATLDQPPPLHGDDCALPAAPDCLYLHDMAIAPEARGGRCADALLQAFFGALSRLGLGQASLTAVNGAAPYWQRRGFAAWPTDAARLASYGDGAVYMRFMASR